MKSNALSFWVCLCIVLGLIQRALGDPVSPDDASRISAGLAVVQASATPILSSLLKQLQAEGAKSAVHSEAVVKWCSHGQRDLLRIMKLLQEESSELAAAAQQAGLESKRLKSQEELSVLSGAQKEEQSEDAGAIADFAATEFASEQQEAATTIGATRRALTLAEGHEDLGDLAVAETGGAIRDDEAKGPRGGANGNSRGQLLQSLQQLSQGMEQEQHLAHEEQERMVQGLATFSERLNTSLILAHSQSAAFKSEAAQRRREELRSNSRLADLSVLLRALREGSAATASACQELGSQGEDIGRFIAAEAKAVAALLKQLHAADVFFTHGGGHGAATGAEAPPSLLQLQSQSQSQLEIGRALAGTAPGLVASPAPVPASPRTWAAPTTASRQPLGKLEVPLPEPEAEVLPHHPEETETAAETEVTLKEEGGGGSSEEADPATTKMKPEALAAPPSSSALQDIQQFVASIAPVVTQTSVASTSASASASASAQTAGLGPGERRTRTQQQRSREPEGPDSQGPEAAGVRPRHQLECDALVQEGRRDLAVLSRSLDRAKTELGANKASILELQEASRTSQEQQRAIAQQLEQLAALAQGTDAWVSGLRGILRGHAEQVMVLATDLSEQLASEEPGPSTCQAVRDLAQRLGLHQRLLESYSKKFQQLQGSLETAGRAVQRRWQETLGDTQRQLLRLRGERQLLTALVQAKSSAWALSARFQRGVGSLCSPPLRLGMRDS